MVKCLRDEDYCAADANSWSVYACVTDTINIEAGISPVATTAFKSSNVHRTHTTLPVFDVDTQEPSNIQRPNVFLAVVRRRIDRQLNLRHSKFGLLMSIYKYKQ